VIWYAAYGSNLSRERFHIYLNGGTPDGATHRYPGCRDATPPRDDRSLELSGLELCFGGSSQTWGGGVAFVRAAPARSVKARLYLITHEQFLDVVAQENWLEPGSIDDGERIGDHMYGFVPRAGEVDGIPVRFVTQAPDAELRPPTLAYVAHIAAGLREAHGMDDAAIEAYLRSAPGMD
jgi:hypothetical protein